MVEENPSSWKKKGRLLETDLASTFILELSIAEIKFLIQLALLYKASNEDSPLTDFVLSSLNNQTNISIDPNINDVFRDILKFNAKTNKSLCRLNSVPFVPYEEKASKNAKTDNRLPGL
jgi:hypothetical protein